MGALLADLILGEGDAYHPGGIDYDGRFIWVPVAEYRPDSHAVIYRVDPRTMTATVVLRAADHIGAVVYDRATGQLQGVSWGGRRFYDWRLTPGGNRPRRRGSVPNRSSYIDYQDCHGLGGGRMLCRAWPAIGAAAGAPFQLGGWEIVDLADHRPVWQAPIALWAPRPGDDPEPVLRRGDGERRPRLVHARRQPLDDLRLRRGPPLTRRGPALSACRPPASSRRAALAMVSLAKVQAPPEASMSSIVRRAIGLVEAQRRPGRWPRRGRGRRRRRPAGRRRRP